MTQVIDFIGGEYRNRTGVHGFAIRKILLISKGKIVNGLVSFRVWTSPGRNTNEPDRPPGPTTAASWRSGDAADCKSVYTGSIPVLASNKIIDFVAFGRL